MEKGKGTPLKQLCVMFYVCVYCKCELTQEKTLSVTNCYCPLVEVAGHISRRTGATEGRVSSGYGGGGGGRWGGGGGRWGGGGGRWGGGRGGRGPAEAQKERQGRNVSTRLAKV